MNPIFRRFVVFLSLSTLIACSSVQSPAGSHAKALLTPAEQSVIKKSIYQQYHDWKGTRYRLGGTDKNGVDCSALVHITYRQQFGISLPRTTQEQVKLGRAIERSTLQPGDLVFFKIGSKTRHVGIYIEDEKFLHASTSQGVIISELSNNYWKAKYWQARRLSH